MTPRLFLRIAGTEARRLMAYRVDFWLTSVVGFAVNLGVAAFLWGSMSAVPGYDLAGILRYYAAAILLGKLVRGPERAGAISQEIYEGGYTRYLVYPARFLPFKYAQHLGSMTPSLVQLLVFGALCPFFLDSPWSGITPASALMALSVVALANLAHFLLAWPLQAVSFWADNVWSLMAMLQFGANLLGGLLLPLDLFPAWARDALLLTPFPYFFYVPVKALYGELPPEAWARGMAVLAGWNVALWLAGREVWRRGDRQYSGVGI